MERTFQSPPRHEARKHREWNVLAPEHMPIQSNSFRSGGNQKTRRKPTSYVKLGTEPKTSDLRYSGVTWCSTTLSWSKYSRPELKKIYIGVTIKSQNKLSKELWYSSGITELLVTPVLLRFALTPQAPGVSVGDQRRHGIDLLYREHQVPLHYYRPDRGTARHWFPAHLLSSFPPSLSLYISFPLFFLVCNWW